MPYTEADSYEGPNEDQHVHLCQHFVCVGGLIDSLVSLVVTLCQDCQDFGTAYLVVPLSFLWILWFYCSRCAANPDILSFRKV
jgi:hypothetical protein